MDDFFKEFNNTQWKGRLHPTEKEITNLRLNGYKGMRGSINGPNFFDWFKNICKVRSSVHNVFRQLFYGFRKRVSSYGCYDVNGYRFQSEKYERNKTLATTNSGVCVTCSDGDGNVLEYFGVIEDIIKISWEGKKQLDPVLFYCHWFDPTHRGVTRTENLGLVEVKHGTRLWNFEPFVLACQVTQVYYLSYACVDKPNLRDWWVVYKVAPRGHLLPVDSNSDIDQTEGPIDDISFFQEDGLEGTFVIDLVGDFEITIPPISNEITDPKELEELEKQNVASQQEDTLESDEEEEEDDTECYENCYEEKCSPSIIGWIREHWFVMTQMVLIVRHLNQRSQFRYANYSVDDKMKKGPILGVILKQEYPPLIEGTSRTGQQFQYHASKWEHYYHIVRDDGQTQADRVKEEFWSIYSVPVELEDEADQIFEKYAHTQRGTVDGSSHASANLVTNSDSH